MEETTIFQSPALLIRKVLCTAARGEAAKPEWQTVASIAIPLRGCYEVERKKQSIVADVNTAVFFDVDCPHRVSHPADDGDETLALTLRADCGVAAFAGSHVPLRPPTQLRLRRLLGDIARCEEPLRVEESAMELVAQLAGAPQPQLTASRSFARVQRAKAYLNEHFRERVVLDDVARAVGSSPFNVSRTFPRATGTTLHRYLMALRTGAALDAIARGETDLARIAVDAGFAHHSHLTKTFVAAYGATPTALRSNPRYFPGSVTEPTF